VIDFVAANNPPFGIATIHPIYVFGRSLVQETADQLNGTNRLLFLSLTSGAPLDGQFIGDHVDDVAIAHVRALTRSGLGPSARLNSGTSTTINLPRLLKKRYALACFKRTACDDPSPYSLLTSLHGTFCPS
jgi:hypothetical protein